MEDLALTFTGVNLVSRVTRDIGRDLGVLETQASSVGTRISSAWSGVAGSLMAVGKIGIIADLTGGGAFLLAAKQASDLDYSLNQLVTHAGYLGNIQQLRAGLQALGETTGITASTLAQADYFISSQGGKFAQYAANMDVMTAAAKTSAMTGSDLNLTVKALGLMLNNFPGEFKGATDAAAAMNAVVSSGVMTMDQFVTSMTSGVLGKAGITGQSFAEIGAMFDTLTRATGGPNQAAMAIRNLETYVGKITQGTSKAWASIGLDQSKVYNMMVSSPDGMIAALSLIKTHLAKLSPAAQASFEALAFGGTRGTTAAQILIRSLTDVGNTLKANGSLAGEFNKLWDMSKTQPQIVFKAMKVAFQDLLMNGIEPLMPMLILAMQTITQWLQKGEAWIDKNKDLVASIVPIIAKIAVLAPVLSLFVGTAMRLVAFLTSPLRLVIAVLGAAFVATHNHLGSLSGMMDDIQGVAHALQGVFMWLGDVIFNHVIPALAAFFKWFDAGPLQNFEKGIGIIGRGIEGIFAKLTGGGGISFVDDLKNAIQRFSQWFADKGARDIVAAVEAITNVFGALYIFITRVVMPPVVAALDWISGHTTILKLAIEALLLVMVVNKVAAFTQSMIALGGVMKNLPVVWAAQGIANAAKALWDFVRAEEAAQVVGGIPIKMPKTWQISGPVAATEKAAKWGLPSALEDVAAGSAGASAGGAMARIAPAAMAAGGAIVDVVGSIAAFLSGAGEALLVVAAIAAVAAAVWAFRDAIFGFFGKIPGWIGDAARGVAGAVGTAFGAIFSGIGDLIGFVAKIPGAIWNAIVHLPEELGTALGTAARIVIKGGRAILHGLDTGIKAAWNAIGSFLIGIPGHIWDIFSGAATWLYNAGGNLVSGLWQGWISIWNGLVGWLRSIPGAIADFFRNGSLIEAGKRFFTGLWNGIKSVWNTVTTWFHDAPGHIADFFRSAGSWLYNAGRDVIVGFWNGIKSVWDSVTTWFHDAPGKFIDAFRHAFDSHSPSRVMMAEGHNVTQGFLIGLQQGIGPVKAALAQMTPAAMNMGGTVRFTPIVGSPQITAANRTHDQQQHIADEQLTVLERIAALLQQLVNCEPGSPQRVGIEALLQQLLRTANTSRQRGIRSAV